MTQYLMAVHHDYDAAPPPDDVMQQMYADVDVYNKKLTEAGAWVFGGGLEAPSTATVVRSEGGEVLTTDGPYAEAKEVLGGFWVIEAPDLDAALSWASEASTACRAPIEVRPFQSE
jgi:hypothetical protein